MLLNRAEIDNPKSTIWDSTRFFAAEHITWIQCSKERFVVRWSCNIANII
jgi:hypothetical protein